VCVGVFVAQSIRVEAYLPQHVADELDRVTDNRSEYIREAVIEKLDGERIDE
jgi:metal-responsive CopG/Arc/MetJ family transcriptional regulator